MQDGENNHTISSKKTHHALKWFFSDASVSFLHHSYSRLGDGFLLVFADTYSRNLTHIVIVDGLEVCVDDIRGNHLASKCALCLSIIHS